MREDELYFSKQNNVASATTEDELYKFLLGEYFEQDNNSEDVELNMDDSMILEMKEAIIKRA